MNTPILNREFKHPDDGWYHIEAVGNHPAERGRTMQVIDREATQTIVNRFNADARSGKLRHGQEMLIDHEHFAERTDKESVAYGWLTELQNRDDGIYGRVRWTTRGKAAVDGGEYRFFSTVYDNPDLKVLNTEGGVRHVRPLRLDGLTLTNMPNNRGQKPITNREQSPAAASAAADSEKQQHQQQNRMKNIAARLKLSAEASEDAILEAVEKLTNRAETAEAKVNELTAFTTKLTNRNTELETEQVDGLLEAHGIAKDDPKFAKLQPVLGKLANREERAAFLNDVIGKPAAAATQQQQRKLTNRETNPNGSAEGADEKAKADKILNRARELQGKGIKDFSTAYAQATRELVK